eukprot:TRINITY_DN5866_c0_g1_i1.p1 TRINITY_DN5866_c0_g1~~TRINITY_DN5866_c0_g1_i1.p1  ORF type:complete len:569 (-),score=111.96 TRINITY_DN5866_c0_g1_i1:100-1806(-)
MSFCHGGAVTYMKTAPGTSARTSQLLTPGMTPPMPYGRSSLQAVPPSHVVVQHSGGTPACGTVRAGGSLSLGSNPPMYGNVSSPQGGASLQAPVVGTTSISSSVKVPMSGGQLGQQQQQQQQQSQQGSQTPQYAHQASLQQGHSQTNSHLGIGSQQVLPVRRLASTGNSVGAPSTGARPTPPGTHRGSQEMQSVNSVSSQYGQVSEHGVVLSDNLRIKADSVTPPVSGSSIAPRGSSVPPISRGSTVGVPQNYTGGGSFISQTNADLNGDLTVELESLRRSVRMQEDTISKLRKEVQVAREGENQSRSEAEAVRVELARVSDDLRMERMARGQAEAAAAEQQAAADLAMQAAQEKPKHWSDKNRAGAGAGASGDALAASGDHGAASGGYPAGGRRGGATTPISERRGGRDKSHDAPARPESARPAASPPRGGGRAPANNASRMRSRPEKEAPKEPKEEAPVPSSFGNQQAGRQAAGKRHDEVDTRLHEFLERGDTGLLFRRLNRGWYAFRRSDEPGPRSLDRNVEISIVNNKLMARFESSTHDPGWNNGKLGPIERFVAYVTALPTGN